MSDWWRDPEWQKGVDAQQEAAGVPVEHRPVCWRKGKLQALVSRHPVDEAQVDLRWHISLAHAERVPNWSELAACAHDLRPGVAFVVGIPPKSWWINVHPNVIHLWEFKDENLIGQWRYERKGHTPT